MLKRYFISIRNIPWTVSNVDFEKHFSVFGDIKHAKVIFNKYGLSTGCGFIEYYDESAMQNALQTTHILEEKKLSVVKGSKYIEEERLQEFVSKYIPQNYMLNQEDFVDKNNTQQNKFTNRYKYFDKKRYQAFANIQEFLREREKINKES